MALIKLFRPLSLSVGLRYAFASSNHRFASFIALLSTLGIMLGVAALIVVLSVMNGLEGELKDRMLAAVPHAVATGPDGLIAETYDYGKLAAIPGVEAVAPQITDDVMIQGKNGIYGATLYGVDPRAYPEVDLIRASAGTRAFDNLLPLSYELIAGWDLLEMLGGAPGEEVRIISASRVRYTPFGRIPSQRLFTVSGAYAVGSSTSGMILANIEDARKLAHVPAGYVSGFRVWLRDPFAINEFAEAARAADPSLVIADWRTELGEFFQSVAMERLMMGLMLALIIVVAIFNMLSSLAMVVSGKVGEIAVLRTLGAGKRTIMWIFVAEGALSGVIGSALGLILGLLLVENLDSALSALGINLYISAGGAGIPRQVDYAQLAAITAATVALSFAITIYPSVKAAGQPPAESLRYE